MIVDKASLVNAKFTLEANVQFTALVLAIQKASRNLAFPGPKTLIW